MNESIGQLAPHYKGWALNYVIESQPIPEKWRNEFYTELVSEDFEYKSKLETSIKKFGVRWV